MYKITEIKKKRKEKKSKDEVNSLKMPKHLCKLTETTGNGLEERPWALLTLCLQ